MASNNRATQINKVLKVTKKHFKPVEISPDRTVLEQLLYACCAENSLHEAAAETFAALASGYYDWNEVRVTSIRELQQVMKGLNDPKAAATRLKRVLQSVFETHYSFDLELMKKQNIGQTVKQIEKYNGTTRYIVSFVTQNALGGHAIPINDGLLESMRVVGVISDNEAKKGTVPGLERAVPKNKGPEVSTILHQLGVELSRSPYGPNIRKLLLEIEPTCKERLPKRPSKKADPPAEKAPKKAAAAEDKKKKGKPKAEAKSEEKPSAKPAAAAAKKKATKSSSSKAAKKKQPTKKKVVVKKKKKKAAPSKKTAKKKSKPKTATKKSTKSTTKKLKKKKPR
ncbi:MAG: hypothetical protein AAGD11_09755 [Planctomycetota bacterium]